LGIVSSEIFAHYGSRCKHEYVNKHSQSVPPPLDLRSDGTTIYKLAVVCKKCRIHADIVIDHSNASNSCPSSENPLHHFQRAKGYDITENARVQYAWQCSVAECRTSLFIIYRKSRLDDEDIELLSNPELLKRRYNALIQDDPEREGIKLATPMDALSRLRRYIKDSLLPQHAKRQIPANNKRFQEAYGMNGEDCAELLKSLGFTYAVRVMQ
jgi:ubiquitin carboxyl-terminal hydrolase 25/28